MPDRYFERLHLVTERVPTYESVRVLVPEIAYDDELDCYYVVPDGLALSYRTKTLPANFHTHELMDVNPGEPASLLAFQQAWGLLTLPNRRPLRAKQIGVFNDVILTPDPTKDGGEAYRIARELFNALDTRHPGIESALTGLMMAGDLPHFYPFAPRTEVETALRYLQESVMKLVDAVTVGYDNWEGINYRILTSQVDAIERDIAPYFPRIRVAPTNAEDTPVEPPVLPLSNATLAQLVGYLTSEEGYRVCANCNRYFIYKRHTSGEFVRNRRSDYCSDVCKAQAGASRQAARRKAARQAAKKAKERKVGDGESD